ncbi:helix-turn-helix domain-containing protein [Bradyrhizobium ontarionense]|uniref:Helix-turn-helix domain-containing protein n=1 Tax=Bradyrhizobium ontarionense TaxID=2898149 RepID=A0ABY3R522_9BRAD|nr:helix-turn-helix domain-containing protein [Bradyrhizobium sp. A19]UFZ02142.1 helix-turn-helix domain-containing protein [Bradyrhizobium sp. A19]
MNKLTVEERARILDLLCEGLSIRAVTRVAGASKNTVAKLLLDAGNVCSDYHDANVRNVRAVRVQIDETWSFTSLEQKSVEAVQGAPKGVGDTWTWTAIEADSKLIVSFLVGARDAEHSAWFLDDLMSRLANRAKLTSDGHRAYLQAEEGRSGYDIDDALLLKLHGSQSGKGTDVRYSPVAYNGTRRCREDASLDEADVSTSAVEQENPAMPMHLRRSTVLTNALSKKIQDHANAVALHVMYYNFVRIHKALSITPAMAAGIADRRWEIADITMLIESAEAKLVRRASSGQLADRPVTAASKANARSATGPRGNR